MRFAQLYNEQMAPMMLADIERYAYWDPIEIFHSGAYPDEMLKLTAENRIKVRALKEIILNTTVADEQEDTPQPVTRLAPPEDDPGSMEDTRAAVGDDSATNTQSMLSDVDRPNTATSDVALPHLSTDDDDDGDDNEATDELDQAE